MSSFVESQGPTLLPQMFFPGQSPHVTVFWDTSLGPVTNDPIQKLGNFGSRMGAIAGLFDDKSQSFTLLDGYHKGLDVTSFWPLNPDNWTPRLHDELGHGKDSTWDVRLSADHTNKDSSRETRNTFITDQETQQQWGELGDIFRVIQKGTDVDDKELFYTDSAFLEIFSPAQDPRGGGNGLPLIQGNKKRGAVGVDISRNLGMVCDKSDFGAFSHVMVFLKPQKPPVATPGGGNPVETPGANSNERPPVASVDPNDPSFQPPSNNRPGELGGSGNKFQVVGGVINVNGSPIHSQPPPPPPPPADDDSNPTRPKKENELGLRLDTGWLVDKLGKVARFTDEQPPSGADQGDGDIKLCTIFVLDSDASPDDKLDTLVDDNSNHKKIPKPVKKKKFAAWVKVPKPGNCECHHYDYSYHHPPPGSSPTSSGAASVSTPGGGGGSGTGSSTPEGPDESPDPKPGTPTVDRAYQNPDGSPIPDDAPSEWNSQPSMQTQAGWAPPRSPGYSMRGNILPSDFNAGWNPVGSVMATKAARYPGVTVQLLVALAQEMEPGDVIEINVILGQHASREGPSAFYRQAFVFRAEDGWDIDPREYEIRFYFAGFAPEESLFTVLTERRNDTTHGTNSDAELSIMRTSILSDGL